MDSYLTLAEDVLREARQPLSSREILKRAYSLDIVPHRLFGNTQHKTLQARLSEDILAHRERSLFFRTEPGRFFLREFLLDESVPDKYRRFILARRRKRDLPSRNALALSIPALSHLHDVDKIDPIEIFELLRSQRFHYLRNASERSLSDVVVWSFVLVVRSHYVLTYILAASSMGKVNAAALTTQALNTFPNIEQIIMVGIAGGCPHPEKTADHVRLGDVVTVNHLGILEYDNIKETEHGIEIRSTSQKPSAHMLRISQQLASLELQGKRPWEDHLQTAMRSLAGFDRPPEATDVLHKGQRKVRHPTDSSRRTSQPRIHSGVIATADTLQKNPKRRDLLRDTFGVKAIEMEGAGIQGAAWHQGKDVFVIRGICDYCDLHKNDTWQNYSALSAAAYARAFIETIPAEWF